MSAAQIFPLDTTEADYVDRQIRHLSERAQFQTSLERLLQRWQSFVEQIEKGYADSIYEYTNDLTVRDLLDGIEASAPAGLKERLRTGLKELDDRFEAATQTVDRPVAAGEPPTGFKRWRRVPIKLLDELGEDLRSEGVIR